MTSIDREALRRKYRAERDKRLRPDGNAQYLQLTGQFARYLEDPYTPQKPRAPPRSRIPTSRRGGRRAEAETPVRHGWVVG